MVYLEYEEQKIKYLETQRKYDEVLNEKEVLFSQTQPRSVQFDKERVSGGEPANTFDEYLIKKEKKKIDERLNEIQAILEDRAILLSIKEEELRQSKALEDRVYCCRVLDRMRMQKIIRVLNYSEAHIYRVLRDISENIKLLKDERK